MSSVEINPKHFIQIKGARSNNLKGLDLIIPKNKLIVVTGVSGSGKSSLVIDTLYAEGQRRYVESLSSYARQFLDRMKKPEVDFIKGLSPAIAIEQKVSTSNARSTVGSMTELYDYIRMLYARIGKTFSPISNQEVKKHEVHDVVDFIFGLEEGSKIQITIPMNRAHNNSVAQELSLLMQKGYNRVIVNTELISIEDLICDTNYDLNVTSKSFPLELYIVIDRFVVNSDPENKKRAADSVQLAFGESNGDLTIFYNNQTVNFNNRFELDGMAFLEPSPQLFSYNNPYGACPKCEGYGQMIGIDPDKVIPNEQLSVFQGAVAVWNGSAKDWLDTWIAHGAAFDFPIHKPYKALSEDQKSLLWHGNSKINGIYDYFTMLEEQSYKIQYRIILSRYRGKTKCADCQGGRLRKEASYVKIGGKSISDLINLPISDLSVFFTNLQLNDQEKTIASRLLKEINVRLDTMIEIGLGYLFLDRQASSLSGGETQRINLTRTIGSNLSNSLYILDEPSVGLHPKDTEKLVKILKKLRDLHNTVVVIEHEEAVIRSADYIIDIGPKAGVHGGSLVFSGSYESFLSSNNDGLTVDYLIGKKTINIPKTKRKIVHTLKIEGARQHNLKNINVTIPLQALTVVCGVSGSGKTSLVKHILYPGLRKIVEDPASSYQGKHDTISGDIKMIKMIDMISQQPLGKSSRSNPITYVKGYDDIRKLFSDQQASKIRGFEPRHFSFNVEGGRCETCKGEGFLNIEMQFLADVVLECEDCGGHRFQKEVLEVKYNDKNIFDVLEMTVEEALIFFKDKKKIVSKLQPLYDVGLDYIKLGQSSNTLSGGEAQRVKLASYLTKEYNAKNIFFIFDEPTTGLHFDDIHKLMNAFHALVENGHSVVVVEHNIDVIKSADWVIDLGPVGGNDGGYLMFEGRPEELSKTKTSITGKYIKF